jgi:hypothetical protein
MQFPVKDADLFSQLISIKTTGTKLGSQAAAVRCVVDCARHPCIIHNPLYTH